MPESQTQPPDPTDWSVPREEVAGTATTRRTVGDFTAAVAEREDRDGWHWWVSRAGQDVRYGDVFESLDVAKACADRALALEAEGITITGRRRQGPQAPAAGLEAAYVFIGGAPLGVATEALAESGGARIGGLPASRPP